MNTTLQVLGMNDFPKFTSHPPALGQALCYTQDEPTAMVLASQTRTVSWEHQQFMGITVSTWPEGSKG